LALVLLTACSSAPPPPPPAAVPGVVESRWRVLDETIAEDVKVVGFVARTRYPAREGDFHLWLVENDRLQELGYLDANGRVFRARPFGEAPEWVATAGLEEGVRLLLNNRAAVRLEKLGAGWEEAAASRTRQP
jgi:hypothetical protein